MGKPAKSLARCAGLFHEVGYYSKRGFYSFHYGTSSFDAALLPFHIIVGFDSHLKRMYLLIRRLLFVYLGVLFHWKVINGKIGSCEVLHNSDKDVWLKGEATAVAFPLQLVAVYSYAPVSFVLGTNLLIGDLFASSAPAVANTPNTNATNKGKSNVPVSFSAFFDSNHFIWYWSQHKLDVVTSQFYYFCFQREGAPFKHEAIRLNRVPEFTPLKSHEFSKLLATNKARFPFPNHHLVTIEGRFKMIGFYNFWDNLPMLQYVHQSLKPAVPIEKFSRSILNILSTHFIAVHLRVDEEAFPISALPSSGTLDVKPEAFLNIINHIKQSACFHDLPHLNNEIFLDPPALYLMTNTQYSNKNDRRKLKSIIDELNALGFVNVFTRKKLVDQFYIKRQNFKANNMNNNLHKNTLSNGRSAIAVESHDDLALYKMFSSEQLQYIDMIVSRQASCFIPSLLPTVASYLIKRFAQLDKNSPEDFAAVNASTYGNLATYRDWGL